MGVAQNSYHVDPKYFKALEPSSHASHIEVLANQQINSICTEYINVFKKSMLQYLYTNRRLLRLVLR